MTPASPFRVIVLGGGIAAAEAVLALRAHAEERVEIDLIAPDPAFAVRAQSTALPFTGAPVQHISLEDIVHDAEARLIVDRGDAVAPAAKRVRLASGAQREYDALVLALGARARAAVPGATTFRDQRDAHLLEDLPDELAVAVPAGVAWSLPAYEIALMAAAEGVRVTLVTPELSPLEVFGGAVSTIVAGMLAERDIDLVTASAPGAVDRAGLRLVHGGTIPADRVVAIPALVGHRMPGIPAAFGGFVPTRSFGRVDGLSDVFAVGDMTAFPVKQGGLAAQQADAAAALVALRAGATPPMPSLTSVLRTQLLGADDPLFLEAVLDSRGHPLEGRSMIHTSSPWWPEGTLFCRHLSPWIAARALTPTP